jgi:hypothetical protein
MSIDASAVAVPVRRVALLGLLTRIALLLISPVLVLWALGLWGSAPRVTYADGAKQATCSMTFTAIAGRGTSEPRDYYAPMILRPNIAKNAWQADNRVCTQEMRIRLVIGFMAMIAGVGLFVVRRRLPGRWRSLREPPRASARFRAPTLAVVVVVVELVLGAVTFAIGQAAVPVQALPRRTARVPSALPAALTAVREKLEHLGYHQTSVSPYPMQFQGIAPTAETIVVIRLDKPNHRGIIELYFAHLDPTDTPAAAQAASIAWARLDGKQPTVMASNDWTLHLSSRHDALGWHDKTRDVFVLFRYEPAPALVSTSQLLRLLAAK